MKLDDAPEFLTYEQLAEEIAHYTYRPGWTLSVYLHPWEGPIFRVVAEVPDAAQPGHTTQLRINSLIPPMETRRQFGHWLVWRLGQIETHECREYLRRRDSLVTDPHDPIEP